MFRDDAKVSSPFWETVPQTVSSGNVGIIGKAVMNSRELEQAEAREKQERLEWESSTVEKEIDQRIAAGLTAIENLQRSKARLPAVILKMTRKERADAGIHIGIENGYPF